MSFHCNERPGVSVVVTLVEPLASLFLALDEAPHFVGLNVLYWHVSNDLLQERLAVLANDQNQVT
jgi:hypothetical protein